MWDEQQIDSAIDEAARRLTAGEPGSDFRARVMARIVSGSGPGARMAALLSWRPALGACAVAALLVGAFITGRQPSRTAREMATANTAAGAVRLKPDPTVQPEPGSAQVRLSPTPQNGFGAQGKPDAPFEVSLTADPTYESRGVRSDVEPLTTPALDLEAIVVGALPAGEPIHIEPLQAADSIAVAPLSVEIEGDPR